MNNNTNTTKCPECDSTNLSWDTGMRNNSGVVTGKLNINDVEPIFFLGCNQCFETIRTISAQEYLEESQTIIKNLKGALADQIIDQILTEDDALEKVALGCADVTEQKTVAQMVVDLKNQLKNAKELLNRLQDTVSGKDKKD